ncbi:MAG: hypothetical protein OXC98_02410 [bacterium]|nr:hypothetical protein [Acidimicrobiia bacterium]MCY4649209.1 hypothetical protein [bacterium]
MKVLLALFEHPAGVDVGAGNRMTYDFEADVAHFGACSVTGPALRWEVTPVEHGVDEGVIAEGAALSSVVTLDGSHEWLMRCDRVDFPRGGVAHRHVHPGPGIRRLLFGELTVTTGGLTTTHRADDPWFESGPEPVYAEASAAQEAAFVRVMLLPAKWAGRRTIRYLDPADAARPARQTARVFREESLQ